MDSSDKSTNKSQSAALKYALCQSLGIPTSEIVDGDLPTGSGPYVQVKAIEALGHIQAPEAVPTLQRIVVARKVFGWVHPQEMRIAAMQTLSKLAPDWFPRLAQR